jgi:hypothetical protein
VDQQINNRGGAIANGTIFNDLLQRSAFPYQVVNGSGQVYIELPPKSYSVWIQKIGGLPVSLLSFKGQEFPGKTELEWRVTNETDMQQYIVERSLDQTDYNSLGTVTALNNITGTATYKFTDNNLPAVEYLFYRLKMISKDGSLKYSDVVKIKRNYIPFDVFVTPNPAMAGKVKLTITSSAGKSVNIAVFNMNGQQVYHEQRSINAGTNSLVLGMPVQAPGTYAVLVSDGMIDIKKKFVIK